MPCTTKTSVSAILCLALAACGGGGGGTSGASAAARALSYDPVYASAVNPTIGTAIGTTGVSGVALLTDNFNDRITFESVRIRTSNNGETLTITLNGTNYVLEEENQGISGIYTNDQLVMVLSFDENAAVDFFNTSGLTGNNFGLRAGYVGVETPLAALPSGTASYNGNLTVAMNQTGNQSGLEQITGTMYLDVNFDSGAMAGTWVLGLENTGTPRGTVQGSTQGNGILGTITLAPESGFAGDLDMVGKAFGQDGETIAGVAGGTGITEISTGDQYVGDGDFTLEQQLN